MAILIDLRKAEDTRDVVHRAVQALAEGKLVAFPTETVYGLAASALHEGAVDRLLELKGRPVGQALTLAIRSADEAMDYVPTMSPLSTRLARRCWPGPVTLVLDLSHPESVMKRLPPRVQQAVCPKSTIGLRVPAHNLILSVLRLTAGPLVLTSANLSGQPDAVNSQQILDAFDGKIDLILDDGRSKFGQPSSVVHVSDRQVKVLRKGVISGNALKRLASLIVLFVCTGNTCRSPMAEGLMRRRLAERLGCTVEELEDRGVLVVSAGIAAMAGGRPAREAVEAMQELGLDLSAHESQPLSDRLLRFADLILTMTRGHREAILAQWPDVAARTHTLSKKQQDVADPIGGPLEMYRRCAQQIDGLLELWVRDLDLDQLIPEKIEERE